MLYTVAVCLYVYLSVCKAGELVLSAFLKQKSNTYKLVHINVNICLTVSSLNIASIFFIFSDVYRAV